jgi:manganese-dependent inorganic pyrophosphatase
MKNNREGVVFAYVNPDTDGVSASVGYSFLKKTVSNDIFLPVVFGKINNETEFVFNHFGLELPQVVESLVSDVPIVLVDTHHKNQLPSIPFENVVEIFDHHPEGDSDAFPNALIYNELIGAATTLIVEQFQRYNVNPTKEMAGVLGAAIISNTLNFSAPSTSPRDRACLNYLSDYAQFSEDFVKEMFLARSNVSEVKTFDILDSDFKSFNFANVTICICQAEIVDANLLLDRSDLFDELTALQKREKANFIFLNIVDISKCQSVLVAGEKEMQQALREVFHLDFDESVSSHNRILLRKTDLVPRLRSYLENLQSAS